MGLVTYTLVPLDLKQYAGFNMKIIIILCLSVITSCASTNGPTHDQSHEADDLAYLIRATEIGDLREDHIRRNRKN